jgi:gas vesicle protein
MGRRDWDDEEPYVIIEKRSGSAGSFLVGLAIGAGVALLMAPRSGEETRAEIRRGARRARARANDLASDVRGKVSDTIGQARSQVEQRIDDARQAIEVKKAQVTRAMEAGRAAAQQARDDLERRIAETKAAYQAGVDVAREARAEQRLARASAELGTEPRVPNGAPAGAATNSGAQQASGDTEQDPTAAP